MKRFLAAAGVMSAAVCLLFQLAGAAPKSIRKPFGLDKRVPWTTSRIAGSPEPPDPYRLEIAFPGLRFSEPLAITHDAATNRFFVAERHGKIYSFVNEPAVTARIW